MLQLKIEFSDKWISWDVAPFYPVMCSGGRALSVITSNCEELRCTFDSRDPDTKKLVIYPRTSFQCVRFRVMLAGGDWLPFADGSLLLENGAVITGFQYYISDAFTDSARMEHYCGLMARLQQVNVDIPSGISDTDKEEIVRAYMELTAVYRYIDWSLWVKAVRLAMDLDDPLYFQLVDAVNRHLLIRM